MFAQQRCQNLIKILTEKTTKHAELLKAAQITKHPSRRKTRVFSVS